MKRFLGIILAVVLLVSALCLAAFASDAVAYVAYNKGKDANDGLSVATPKRNMGVAGANGAFDIVRDGGTIVVTEKMYFADSYTFQANAPVTITAKYGGKSYVNTSPATNPAAGSFKIAHNRVFNVASDLTFDNIILFSEGEWDTIAVKKGATLTITESVISMSKTNRQFHIKVEEGAKAIINGGIFTTVTGLGEIIIGEGATVESTSMSGAVSEVAAFISYNKGKNTNDGLSAETPKKSFGSKDGDGVTGLLAGGGTLVVSEKTLIEQNYTWNVAGGTVFTAKYNDVSYVNAELDAKGGPSSGVIKFNKGAILTIGSDLTFSDIIIHHEGNTPYTFLVTGGATLTIDESVITTSTTENFLNIYVNEGCSAIINSGTYSSIGGAGSIKVGANVKVLGEAANMEKETVKYETGVCFLDYKGGNNDADGKTAETAVKGYTTGVFKKITLGGTVVVCGSGSVIGGVNNTNTYAMPTLAMPLTFTSVYDGKDYRETATFGINKDVEFVVSSDVILDNLVVLENEGTPIIRVTNGATLTVTDTVAFKAGKEGSSHYKVIVEEGAYAILSAVAKENFTVESNGTVIDYVDGYKEVLGATVGDKKIVELTIGSPEAYINGVAQTLDAAPINRNSRTMLPVRFLANTFGIDNDGIVWDDATKTATLKNATTTIVITIGAPSMTVNGAAVALDSPAVIESSRTYLPVRAIANALGVTNDNISWNDNTKTATLIK